MSTRYHLRPDGEPKVCTAQFGCPYSKMHHEELGTLADARAWAEEVLEAEFEAKAIMDSPKFPKDTYNAIIKGRGIILSSHCNEFDRKQFNAIYFDASRKLRELADEKETLKAIKIKDRDVKQIRRLKAIERVEKTYSNIVRGAKGAAGLTSARIASDGVTPMPPGFAEAKIVVDLDGNHLGAWEDTFFSPKTMSWKDGTKFKFRASRDSDPEKARWKDAENGYIIAKAVVPVMPGTYSTDSRAHVYSDKTTIENLEADGGFKPAFTDDTLEALTRINQSFQ